MVGTFGLLALGTWERTVEHCIYDLLRLSAVISGFDWDDENAFHIAAHEFKPEEVEEVLDGRMTFVAFRRLTGGFIRVVTARNMEASERRLFRRK